MHSDLQELPTASEVLVLADYIVADIGIADYIVAGAGMGMPVGTEGLLAKMVAVVDAEIAAAYYPVQKRELVIYEAAPAVQPVAAPTLFVFQGQADNPLVEGNSPEKRVQMQGLVGTLCSLLPG